MSVLEFFFGKPGPTTAEKFKLTVKEMRKVARQATRCEEDRLEEAHELEIQAKNMNKRGRRAEAARLLRKSKRRTRDSKRFTAIVVDAEQLLALTEELDLNSGLLSGQRKLSALSRQIAPQRSTEKENTIIKDRVKDIARMQEFVDKSNEMFKVVTEHDADDEDEEDEEAEAIDDTLRLWDEEAGRVPVERRDAAEDAVIRARVDALMPDEAAKMDL